MWDLRESGGRVQVTWPGDGRAGWQPGYLTEHLLCASLETQCFLFQASALYLSLEGQGVGAVSLPLLNWGIKIKGGQTVSGG